VSFLILSVLANLINNLFSHSLFLSQSRFEKMMPAVANLIPLLRAFESEAAYLTYQEDYVGACLAALTVAVGSDRLWKPLNNKVLLLTRDNRKAVRLASVKIIHRLFTEVSVWCSLLVILLFLVVSSAFLSSGSLC